MNDVVFPDKRTFERLRRSGLAVSFTVSRPYPKSVRNYFLPIAVGAKRPILLESSRAQGVTGRYSILLAEPFQIFRSKGARWRLIKGRAVKKGSGDPLNALRWIMAPFLSTEKGPLPFAGGVAGLFAYELKDRIEKFAFKPRDPWKLPDIDLGFYDRGVVVDHRERKGFAFRWFSVRDLRRMSYGECAAEARRVFEVVPRIASKSGGVDRPSQLIGSPVRAKQKFVAAVRKIKESIRRGDVYQANLSQLFEFEFSGEPYALYLRQAALNPTAFSAFADFENYKLVSASPERLVRVEGRKISTRPIAGTRPRSANARRDDKLSRELLLSPKERAEHVMLVDLERNDLGRVCSPGSVRVDELMSVERYSHVRHIVSNVVGTLRADADVWDAIRAVFPGGTITGAPKIRAMEIIGRLEGRVRGPYTGSLGYIGFDGDCDLNIVIRTLWTRAGRAYLQAGAGIVADSDPQKEYEETLHKAHAFLDVLGLAKALGPQASA